MFIADKNILMVPSYNRANKQQVKISEKSFIIIIYNVK